MSSCLRRGSPSDSAAVSTEASTGPDEGGCSSFRWAGQEPPAGRRGEIELGRRRPTFRPNGPAWAAATRSRPRTSLEAAHGKSQAGPGCEYRLCTPYSLVSTTLIRGPAGRRAGGSGRLSNHSGECVSPSSAGRMWRRGAPSKRVWPALVTAKVPSPGNAFLDQDRRPRPLPAAAVPHAGPPSGRFQPRVFRARFYF